MKMMTTTCRRYWAVTTRQAWPPLRRVAATAVLGGLASIAAPALAEPLRWYTVPAAPLNTSAPAAAASSVAALTPAVPSAPPVAAAAGTAADTTATTLPAIPARSAANLAAGNADTDTAMAAWPITRVRARSTLTPDAPDAPEAPGGPRAQSGPGQSGQQGGAMASASAASGLVEPLPQAVPSAGTTAGTTGGSAAATMAIAPAAPAPATQPLPAPPATLATAAPPQYDALVADVARRHALDPLLVHAVVATESAYRPAVVSVKGAVGLMQVTQATGARFGKIALREPRENLEAGAAYLSWLMQRFGGRLDLALAGYNAGEGAVARYGNAVPPYAETQAYVRKVLAHYASLRGEDTRAALPAVAPATAPRAATRLGDMGQWWQLLTGGSAHATSAPRL
ncbi:lytic transglycosylase domain-containing protein [Pandoraea sputorum]|uniref:lytic transglycosylase domain-containing protein n=1 Tax=Pandoraea sputorum TaxID=93222 RepID=UPI00125C1FFD|nr:lytic transglycosylase domain-containing protein [Pandoraea sputorum]VVE55973.1 Membrane-bound lytic murein transglycosylase D [Pandoraea sputorum]